MTSSESIAIHKDGQLTRMGTSVTTALDTNCLDFNIPQQSPVLISELAIPDLPDNAIVKEDVRLVPCENGQTGHIIEKSTHTTLPDGTSSRSQWTESVNSCKDDVQIAQISAETNTVNGFVVGALASQGSDQTVTALNLSLANIRCNSARTTEEVENYTGADPDPKNNEQNSFDTCGSPEEVSALGNINETRMRLDRIETAFVPCGGEAGQFSDSIDGFIGTATHPVWRGEAVYNREVFVHDKDDDLESVSSEDTTQRENWFGAVIECSRLENFNIDCDTVYPDVSSRPNFRATDTNGFNYNRTNTISGWEDNINLRPNPPANPEWNETSASCAWLETDNWNCNVGSQTQEGERNRTHSSTSLGQTLQISSWNLIRPATCEETRTSTESCASDQTGSITVNERRIYTSNQPGSGSWGAWTVTSTNNNCVTPTPTVEPETRTRNENCPAGENGSITIEERREFISDGAGGGSWGPWTEISRVVNCSATIPDPETRVRYEECPSGQEGTITINEQRIFISNATGGYWGPWTETSRSDNCTIPPEPEPDDCPPTTYASRWTTITNTLGPCSPIYSNFNEVRNNAEAAHTLECESRGSSSNMGIVGAIVSAHKGSSSFSYHADETCTITSNCTETVVVAVDCETNSPIVPWN